MDPLSCSVADLGDRDSQVQEEDADEDAADFVETRLPLLKQPGRR